MFGVGIIGSGPGVAALHLPTAARVEEAFRVVHVADGGSGRAVELANRLGARSSTGVGDLLLDDEVEVVVVAGPPHLHAEHVRAAVEAGKRGILCEKPLALTHDDVDAVVDAAATAGTVLLVGTNHLFDPAWGYAKHHVAAGGRIRTISITASLPPNGRYHSLVSEPAPVLPVRPLPALDDPRVAAAVVRQLVLGLVVHDLPLVRDLAPGEPEVVFARIVPPVGCAIGFRMGDVLVRISASLQPDGADALWRMAVDTATDSFEIDFPPSFVHGGSARARSVGEGGTQTLHPRRPDDGYVLEWRAWGDALTGQSAMDLDDIRADAHFAVSLADGAAAAVLAGVRG